MREKLVIDILRQTINIKNTFLPCHVPTKNKDNTLYKITYKENQRNLAKKIMLGFIIQNLKEKIDINSTLLSNCLTMQQEGKFKSER